MDLVHIDWSEDWDEEPELNGGGGRTSAMIYLDTHVVAWLYAGADRPDPGRGARF